jgi:hypothetical protein
VAVSAALLVDEVKHQVPVWKGQVFADGSDESVACPQPRCGAGCRWSHPDYHPTGAHRAANRRERRDMKSVDQRLADLLDGVGPLEPVDADVLDALGAVLAADVVSLVDLLVFDTPAICAPCSAITAACSAITRLQGRRMGGDLRIHRFRGVAHARSQLPDRSRKFRGAARAAKPSNRRYEAPV